MEAHPTVAGTPRELLDKLGQTLEEADRGSGWTGLAQIHNKTTTSAETRTPLKEHHASSFKAVTPTPTLTRTARRAMTVHARVMDGSAFSEEELLTQTEAVQLVKTQSPADSNSRETNNNNRLQALLPVTMATGSQDRQRVNPKVLHRTVRAIDLLAQTSVNRMQVNPLTLMMADASH